jgi:hypothetical protein
MEQRVSAVTSYASWDEQMHRIMTQQMMEYGMYSSDLYDIKDESEALLTKNPRAYYQSLIHAHKAEFF